MKKIFAIMILSLTVYGAYILYNTHIQHYLTKIERSFNAAKQKW